MNEKCPLFGNNSRVRRPVCGRPALVAIETPRLFDPCRQVQSDQNGSVAIRRAISDGGIVRHNSRIRFGSDRILLTASSEQSTKASSDTPNRPFKVPPLELTKVLNKCRLDEKEETSAAGGERVKAKRSYPVGHQSENGPAELNGETKSTLPISSKSISTHVKDFAVSASSRRTMEPNKVSLVTEQNYDHQERVVRSRSTSTGHRVRPIARWTSRALSYSEVENHDRYFGILIEPFSDEVVYGASRAICPEYILAPLQVEVYEDWIQRMVYRRVIEPCALGDCSILLKPVIQTCPLTGKWTVTHDCTVVNAFATKRSSHDLLEEVVQERSVPADNSASAESGGCSPQMAIHLWSAGYPYLSRIELDEMCYSVPLDASQRRYYCFSPPRSGRYFRYIKLPPQALGAESYMAKVLHRLFNSQGVGDQTRCWRNEIFCAGETLWACDTVTRLVERALVQHGFRISSMKEANLPYTACCGLMHDRRSRCLRLTTRRAAYMTDLIRALRSPSQWVSAAAALLKCLNFLGHLLSPEWISECSQLRHLLVRRASMVRGKNPVGCTSEVCRRWEELNASAADLMCIPFKTNQ